MTGSTLNLVIDSSTPLVPGFKVSLKYKCNKNKKSSTEAPRLQASTEAPRLQASTEAPRLQASTEAPRLQAPSIEKLKTTNKSDRSNKYNGPTIGDLLKTISKKLNIKKEYIVLYKYLPALNDKNGAAFRSDKLRIDYQNTPKCPLKTIPEQDKHNIVARIKLQDKLLLEDEKCHAEWHKRTLASVGVKDGDIIQLCLMPLRGTHIHTLVAFYVDQEPEVNSLDQEPDQGPKPLNILTDRPVIENIYEGKHITQVMER